MKFHPDARLTLAEHTRPPITVVAERSCHPLLSSLTYLLLTNLETARISRADIYLAISIFFLSHACRLSYQVQPRRFVSSVFKTWFFTLAVLALVGVAKGFFHYFSARVLLAWATLSPLMTITLHACTPAFNDALYKLFPTRSVVVIGASEIGQHLARLLKSGKSVRQKFVGFFDDRRPERDNIDSTSTSTINSSTNNINNTDSGNFINGVDKLLGNLDAAPAYVRKHRIDLVYIALPMASQPRIVQLLDGLQDTTATIKFVPDIFIAKLIQAKVENIFGVPVISICDSPLVGIQGVNKRCLDLLLCLCIAPLVLPLMALIAVLIRLTSSGPIFFKQRRYGLHGEEIVVWKFRTLDVLEDGDATYRQVTRDDDRITSFGRILRKTSLDELPQFINVVLGSMSLVGPRPHAIAVNEAYRKRIAGYMVRHKIKPGITGLAQVNGYRGGDDIESMSKRVEFDLAYLRLWSMSLDIEILLHTVFMLIRGDKTAF